MISREELEGRARAAELVRRRIEKFVNAHGRRIIGWDEILEGGLAQRDGDVLARHGRRHRGRAGGHDVIMTPTDYAYFDYCQGDPAHEPLCFDALTAAATRCMRSSRCPTRSRRSRRGTSSAARATCGPNTSRRRARRVHAVAARAGAGRGAVVATRRARLERFPAATAVATGRARSPRSELSRAGGSAAARAATARRRVGIPARTGQQAGRRARRSHAMA